MQNQTAHAHHITDIVKVMNGGIEFYQEAKTKLDDSTYKAFFDRMIGAKAEAVAELQPFAVAQQGEVETDTSNLVKARQAYTKLMSKITSETTTFTYVDQLEEVEDKVLEELDLALERNQTQDCEVTLRRVKVRMKECHDEMKALQVTAQH
ncbi:PA2169 family four-helix-bundle protein [Marinomonas hwangdonensis]|uniref:PA2169 family four-helix-bundle protein n=1 Tax=Marinomonas hwangdonensis TaxID=1053647 RepID=A0A3M8Q633_9GAMM|nr:PA2169 family four-helix-bundle protein [Marinomonas hwangdonensis]RNF51555.1 PA2169 family four-helix-bundle protein [Marinomonas hwangdonensis]